MHIANKSWFIPNNVDKTAFKKWLTNDEPTLKSLYWFIISGLESCYRCGNYSTVYTIGLPETHFSHDDEYDTWTEAGYCCFVSNIEYLNPSSAEIMKTISNGTFRKDFSKTKNRQGYMNHCSHCDGKYGEFFLHTEPSILNQFYTCEGIDKLLIDDPIELDGGVGVSNFIENVIYKL